MVRIKALGGLAKTELGFDGDLGRKPYHTGLWFFWIKLVPFHLTSRCNHVCIN